MGGGFEVHYVEETVAGDQEVDETVVVDGDWIVKCNSMIMIVKQLHRKRNLRHHTGEASAVAPEARTMLNAHFEIGFPRNPAQ